MISCFQLKPCVKCFSNLFKMLKKLVVEPKTAQPVEPDEEPVDPQLNRSMGAKKLFSLLEWLFN